MKALSLSRPYAWLCGNGLKPIENRDWPTKFRGRFVIHAAKSFDPDCASIAAKILTPEQMRAFMDARHDTGLIAEAVLVDCVTESLSPWFFGIYGFVLEDAKPYVRPIPYRGSLGFFDVPDHVINAARKETVE